MSYLNPLQGVMTVITLQIKVFCSYGYMDLNPLQGVMTVITDAAEINVANKKNLNPLQGVMTVITESKTTRETDFHIILIPYREL